MRRQTNNNTSSFFMGTLLGPEMNDEFSGLDDWIVACTPAVEKSIRNERLDD
jgi:hypothetical protein